MARSESSADELGAFFALFKRETHSQIELQLPALLAVVP